MIIGLTFALAEFVSKKNKMETSQIRSSVVKKGKTPDVPMLYNNIPRIPPRTERPAAASLTPYDTAAALLVELELVPEVVDDPLPTPL